ncbi:hypothetical protein BDQ12DRAFT_685561 [Crucibulum laeve]|uniref:3-beta hydroxysteroid dehydrogenase/isomerase domain-containing protein n=1 Tax=Crucibulum laeve TaxID=68775 RepID=A0A5C3LWR8_9AGAR|nr:hypothetical protein BDQ12DRAFT_685561 [Crucibulum laeve]
MSKETKEMYLVVGGSGLLGRHIVEQLRDRGDSVSVLDLVQRHDDVPFYSGDISEEDVALSALKTSGATCVIHTASPHATTAPPALFWKVNVEGTNAVIAACLASGVKKLIYTSSSGVVFTGSDLNGIDESFPYPTKPMDVYMETKIRAEKAVIAANGKNELLTAIIRPSGIFGSPGDRQLMVGLYNIYDRGRTGVQIGNNKNLTDWTYVTNVADAHVLAADKLSTPADPPVAGEIFYITNDEPWPFWDFTNGIWDRLDAIYPGRRVKKKPFIIPRALGIVMGAVSELIAWVLGKKPTFTRFSVIFSCTARWHNIQKAKRALGYRPRVRLADGMDRLVDWWKEQEEGKTKSNLAT